MAVEEVDCNREAFGSMTRTPKEQIDLAQNNSWRANKKPGTVRHQTLLKTLNAGEIPGFL
jgi:hypothetical protein